MTGRLNLVAVALSLGAASPPPAIELLLTPGAMDAATGTGTVTVEETITGWSAPAGAVLFRLGVMAPNMPSPQPVERFAVTDAAGDVPLDRSMTDGTLEWRLRRAVSGTVRARYDLPIDNLRGSGPPVALHIDGDAFSAPGRALIAIPALPRARVTLRWNVAAMGAGATGVSSYGDGAAALPAGSLDGIERALFMAGHFRRLPAGNFAALWSGTPPFDPRPAMAWTADLHRWMSRFFGDTDEPSYRVLLRANPQNPGGGAALIRSFVVGYGPDTTAAGLTATLGHEMTHTWTAIESIGKWYSEGNAVYYQAQLAWRAGLTSTADYLADVNLTASRYYTNARRDTPEDQVVPHFWEDTRIRVLPYDRGALYFAALNGMLRRRSGGTRSIDALIFAMNRRAAAGEPLDEADWVALIGREIGPDAVALHRTMMAGGLVLPASGDFGPCFRRVVRPIRQFDIGFDMVSLLGDAKVVRGLDPASEAARAGLRDGDRIVSITAGDAVQRDVTRMTVLKGVRGATPFTLTYLPRGRAVPAYQWVRVAGVPDRDCRPAGPAPLASANRPRGV